MGRAILKDIDDSLTLFTVINAGYHEVDGMWLQVYDVKAGEPEFCIISTDISNKSESDAYMMQLVRHEYLDLSEHRFTWDEIEEGE